MPFRTLHFTLCNIFVSLAYNVKYLKHQNLAMYEKYRQLQSFSLSEVKTMRWLVGALLLLGAVVASRGEDEAEGEDGVQFEDDTIYRAVIESCSG